MVFKEKRKQGLEVRLPDNKSLAKQRLPLYYAYAYAWDPNLCNWQNVGISPHKYESMNK